MAQFQAPLAEYNQQQLEQIDTAVANVNTAVANVEALVTAVQNTDIANLAQQVANIGWWANYTSDKYYNEYFTHSTGDNTFETVYAVTGKGYIEDVCIHKGSTHQDEIKVTIDGVVVYHVVCGGANGSGRTFGILNEDYFNGNQYHTVSYDSSPDSYLIMGSYSVSAITGEYPFVDLVRNYEPVSVRINKPIFYNTDFKLEIKVDTTFSGYGIKVTGGVI